MNPFYKDLKKVKSIILKDAKGENVNISTHDVSNVKSEAKQRKISIREVIDEQSGKGWASEEIYKFFEKN